MIQKVKLTREQAEAIEMIRGDTNKGFTQGNIRTQLKKHWRHKPYATLNELTFEQFIVSVLGDYEVEETFEVGDWVVCDEMKIIGQLVRVYDELRVNSIDYNVPQSIRLDELRHATPEEIAEEKQRRWWRKHGKDVWEIKKDDSLIHNTESEHPDIIFEVRDSYIHFTDGHFYPKEYIKENYKVFCFAEDRKDLKV